ncbi:tyrosine-type recombinase/integrase [Geomonas anaerohicana]|uniref:Integrase arm-type DNA-binding domain-containing protein n=1 Tax=Geomonas anaerohicana TaxID=2798583 RepID=A0ABS0YBA6_9BACT|nr:integrase arm-type DNA-binding domain-containing protein [Geomonas anaerohicana]MBJ6749565.1 integrase arm-type DNA-binding domain-containing protein [Geomonas anaerohicana]
MRLSDLQIRKAQPKEKVYRLSDGEGLYLYVHPRGGKWWRFRYRFDGNEKLISFGVYPYITLADARERTYQAKCMVAKGIDPSQERKRAKEAKLERIANAFEAIAREWHKHMVGNQMWSADHAATVLTRLEKDVFPWIGTKPIAEVTAKEIKGILDRVRSRGIIETARRVRTILGQVYTYAIATDRANYDISAGFKGYLPPTSKTRKHMAAVTDPKELAPLLRAMDGYQGSLVAQSALKLLPMLFVRPGELRHMEWAEIDLEAGEWSIPASKMKMGLPHLVPLSRQAVAILEELKPLTGHGKYVFPSTRSFSRCMSDNTINASFRRMGFDGNTIVGHGFRATARTILDEVLNFRPDLIEHQLAHAVRDPNGRAYNRTAFLPQRKEMMQIWSDYLDGLKAGAKVLPFRKTSKE